MHGQEAEQACAGQRAAVNIPARRKDEIFRGDVLASRGSLYPTRMLDVRVEALKHTKRSIRSGSRVHVYHGTKGAPGKNRAHGQGGAEGRRALLCPASPGGGNCGKKMGTILWFGFILRQRP